MSSLFPALSHYPTLSRIYTTASSLFPANCREVEMTIGYIKVLYDRTKLRKDPKSKKTLDDLRLRLFEATSELVNIPERFLPLPDIKNLLICFVGGLEDVKKLYDGSGLNSLYFRQLIIMRKRLSKIARYFEEQCER